MRILIIGLGNPILGDDGAGWKAAEQLKTQIDPASDIQVECASLGGISLMERLVGYDAAILIDTIQTGSPDGRVSVFPFEELPNMAGGHFASAHDASLQIALDTGKQMGLALPKKITVVAIEATRVHDFSEQLSPAVSDAVTEAALAVTNLIQAFKNM